MGLTAQFAGKTIFLDTAPLIYYIEENPRYIKPLSELFIAGNRQECRFISSVITLIETLVLPMREGRYDIVEKYETILTQSMEMIDINPHIAKMTARLRAAYSLKIPDAIQLATGIYHSADCFLTNDKRLKAIKEITIVFLDDL
ncbi:MAG: PIN domain-containing protein [Tannerella sp.]|jgi:predicted nucleic acid-binding protein|nr:PIN domain-containing protein [Tannerella sp.]